MEEKLKIVPAIVLLCITTWANATPSNAYDPNLDPWYTEPTTHMTAGAFSTASSVLPTFNSTTGLYDIAYTGLFGSAPIALDAVGMHVLARSQIGKNSLYAQATQASFGQNQIWDGNADVRTYWRDVWTVSGLTGPTLLTVSGHTDGHIEGNATLQAGLSLHTVMANNGGNRDAGVGFDMYANGYHLSPSCLACVETFSYEDGTNAANYTLNVLIDNGDQVVISGSLEAYVSAVDPSGALIDGLHTSMIDSIFGAPGLILSSDSGRLVAGSDGGFTYAFDDTTPVPEPGTLVLFLIGLGAVGWLRACRRPTSIFT
jgi:hypothetical protein